MQGSKCFRLVGSLLASVCPPKGTVVYPSFSIISSPTRVNGQDLMLDHRIALHVVPTSRESDGFGVHRAGGEGTS